MCVPDELEFYLLAFRNEMARLEQVAKWIVKKQINLQAKIKNIPLLSWFNLLCFFTDRYQEVFLKPV